ncbi:MAG: hypothetical protein HOI53_06145 [Francisellaceae bacterium]|nr:hypothetical protein [Francisellaceae bacterium]MBT6207590.1 hypothetical protein [Francisellaceae bacterium]
MFESLTNNLFQENNIFFNAQNNRIQIGLNEILLGIEGFTGPDFNTINNVIFPTLIRRNTLNTNTIFGPFPDNADSAIDKILATLTMFFQITETELSVEWTTLQTKTPSVYHRNEHGEEMAVDSKHSSDIEAKMLFEGKTAHQQNYCAISKLLHATHDLVQHLGPVQNEIETYKIIFAALEKKRNESPLLSTLPKNYLQSLDHAIWEIIVVGTIFNFKDQLPILYYLNKISMLKSDDNDFIFKCPANIAGIQLAIAINDTRRCSQLASIVNGYEPLAIYLHLDACRGEKNHFLKFANSSDEALTVRNTHSSTQAWERIKSPALLYLHMAHLFGQNVRAKLELLLKNLNIEKLPFLCKCFSLEVPESLDDRTNMFKEINSFCIFLFEAIDNCHSFDLHIRDQYASDEHLENIFTMFIAMMTGELIFARGFSGDKLEELINDHHTVQDQVNITFRFDNLNAWSMYANVLDKYLLSLSHAKTEDKFNIIRDWVLLASQQIGHSSLLLREDYQVELAKQAKKHGVDSIFHEKYHHLRCDLLFQVSRLDVLRAVTHFSTEDTSSMLQHRSTRAIRFLSEDDTYTSRSNRPAHDASSPYAGAPGGATSSTPQVTNPFISRLLFDGLFSNQELKHAIENRILFINTRTALLTSVSQTANATLPSRHPLRIWLQNQVFHLHPRNEIEELVTAVRQSIEPGFIAQYLLCCCNNKTIERNLFIEEILGQIDPLDDDLDNLQRSVNTLKRFYEDRERDMRRPRPIHRKSVSPISKELRSNVKRSMNATRGYSPPH